jgi:AcrR family transcriptional regulator
VPSGREAGYRETEVAPVTTRKRNARGNGGQLRLEILQATVRLIDRGVDRLTLRAIAREAGVAGPSLYDHFSGVDSITNAVIRECYDALIERIGESQSNLGDPVRRLEAACSAYVAYGAEWPYRYALVFRTERNEAERDAVGERGAAALQTLVDGIAGCRAVGRSVSDDPYVDAVALWAGIHGLTTLRMMRPHFAPLHGEGVLRSCVYRLARITSP